MRLRSIFVGILFLSGGVVISQQDRGYDPSSGDLKEDRKSIRYAEKKRQGCCKIKYPSGGYDFFVATEEDCRNNLYFDRFLGENTSLCFQWKD